MKVTPGTRRVLRVYEALFVVLLLAAAGLLGWLATRYVHEWDWTAGGRNTLSQASAKLLDQLPGEVTVVAYARAEPKLLRKRIGTLVERYRRHKPDLRLEFVDPDVDPQRVRDIGVTMDGEMVVEYQGRSEHLQDATEGGLTNALQRVARSGERRMLFLSGHGERDPAGAASYDLSSWTRQLQARGIGIDRVNLLEQAGELPREAILVIASPQAALLAAEVERVVKHVEDGGKLLWLYDPGASGSVNLAGLDALAEKLGLAFEPGIIMDPTVAQVGRMLFGADIDPRVALVANYPDHALTRDFDYNTLFPFAGAIAARDGTQWQPLLVTLSNAWLERGETQGTITYDEGKDLPGPLTIGIALDRKAPGDGEAEQRVLVVADGDFLSNGFIGRAGNMQLGLNVANWLGGDDRLIDIPARMTPDASLQLSPFAMGAIGFGFLLVLPALLLGSGLGIWFARRRR